MIYNYSHVGGKEFSGTAESVEIKNATPSIMTGTRLKKRDTNVGTKVGMNLRILCQKVGMNVGMRQASFPHFRSCQRGRKRRHFRYLCFMTFKGLTSMPDGMKLQGATAEKSGNEKKMVCALSSLALKAACFNLLTVNRFLALRLLPSWCVVSRNCR